MDIIHQAIFQIAKSNSRKVLLVVPTLAHLKVAKHGVLDALERANMAYRVNLSSNEVTLLDTGSKLFLKSLEDPGQLRGSEFDWVGAVNEDKLTDEARLRLKLCHRPRPAC